MNSARQLRGRFYLRAEEVRTKYGKVKLDKAHKHRKVIFGGLNRALEMCDALVLRQVEREGGRC